jgi:hypothetical protein
VRERAAVTVLGALAQLCACVLPADDPTGLEMSWSFFEANEADGDEGVRARTCVGSGVDRVAVSIVDRDDSARHGIFRFDCDRGYQTQADLQIESSDAFVELRGGTYEVVLRDDATSEDLESRTIDISSSGVTIEVWELSPPTSTWTAELLGAGACQQLTLRLFYDDAEAMLAEPPTDEEGAPLETIYREALVSDRMLPVGGTPVPCAAALDGTHVFVDVDRGAYRLEIDVDGIVCALPVEIDQGGAQTTLDLANLPCAG